MDQRQEQIREFFSAYEKRFNDALLESPVVDLRGMIDSFARYFVGASPAGVMGGKNGLLFRLMLRRGYAFYRKIGTKSMTIDALEITPLDDYHVMAKIHWNSQYLRKDGREVAIEFDNIYFLQVLNDTPEIFAYITGDEQKVLRDHGLV